MTVIYHFPTMLTTANMFELYNGLIYDIANNKCLRFPFVLADDPRFEAVYAFAPSFKCISKTRRSSTFEKRVIAKKKKKNS